MTNRTSRYYECEPGKEILAEGFNEMQDEIRQDIETHDHTGEEKGTKLSGDAIDTNADLEVRTLKVQDLTVTGTLHGKVAREVEVTGGGETASDLSVLREEIRSHPHVVPRGAVMSFYLTEPPKGWAPCDGQLWGLTPTGEATTTGYEAGTELPTPDLRGLFVRCLDDLTTNGPAGNDPEERKIGSVQLEQFKEHKHVCGEGGAHSHTCEAVDNHVHTLSDAGAHTHEMQDAGMHAHEILRAGEHNHAAAMGFGTGEHWGVRVGAREPVQRGIWTAGSGSHSHNCGANGGHLHALDSVGDHAHEVGGSGGHSHSLGTVGDHRHEIAIAGGTETRPKNTALFYCIKL